MTIRRSQAVRGVALFAAPIARRAFIAFVGSLLLAVTRVAGAQPDAAAMMARIEAKQSPDRGGLDDFTLAEVMQKFRVPGVSVAVIRDFRIHWAKGYGVADVVTGRLVDTATLFQAASISKPVTAFAASRLVQQGKFSFDADVNTLLTSWKVPRNEKTGDRPVTVRALFSHTSGSDDGFGFPGYNPNQPLPTVTQILNGEKPSNVGAVTFGRPPLTGVKYSGGGTTIMQLAMMDVTGLPFAEVMKRYALDPIGMKQSSYEQPPLPDFVPRTARAHSGGGTAMGPQWHVYPEQAAAGLWTTPSDLARYLTEVQRAVAGAKTDVLSQALARELTSPVGVGPFAVGLQVEKRGEGWYISHGGSNWGFRCDMVGHLRKGYGVVVMTNGDGGGAVINEIAARVAAAYGWDALDKPLFR
jgi:CubicO group peptidase (beta-lactamase class C family)